MNRNTESHFAELPQIDIDRSIFDRSSTHKTSLNVGDLVPIYIDEVLPGDSYKMTTSKVVRLQTLLTPVMDNLYMDTYWFFVPNRLVWSHWKEFCGENTSSAWIPQVEYQIPSISSPVNGFNTGTIADYFGLPISVEWDNEAENRPSALPFRAYALICNEFFRDENLTDPLNIPVGDSNQTGTNGDSYINDVANGGKPFKVAKYHDFFTSALPTPQKGPAVSFGVDPKFSGIMPVVPGEQHSVGEPDTYFDSDYTLSGSVSRPLYMTHYDDVGYYGRVGTSNVTPQSDSSWAINNYWADPSHDDSTFGITGVSFTINELRLAFQLQKFYERNARGGKNWKFSCLLVKKIAEKNWKAA